MLDMAKNAHVLESRIRPSLAFCPKSNSLDLNLGCVCVLAKCQVRQVKTNPILRELCYDTKAGPLNKTKLHRKARKEDKDKRTTLKDVKGPMRVQYPRQVNF